MEYEELLRTVGERLNFPETLLPNDNGVLTLSDGEFTFSIMVDADRTRLELVGGVGALPLGGREGCLRMLLGANCRFQGTKGATLSVLQGEDLVLLNRRERIDGLAPETLEAIMKDFVDSLAEWRETLARYAQVGSMIDEAKADAAAARDEGGTFLRV